MRPLLEEVFKTSGVPTHTFVEPYEYHQLLINLRTPARGLVVEGPSGIGKTSSLITALKTLGIFENVTLLSARRTTDIPRIERLSAAEPMGTVVIDDFHKLTPPQRAHIANIMKVLADNEPDHSKLIVIGINRAGENLISFANDLVNRIDIVRFDSNPDYKTREMITKGEAALNVRLNVADEITKEACGSFYLAQLLCKEVCLGCGITEAKAEQTKIEISFEGSRLKVWERLALVFRKRCVKFCQGAKLKKAGRAPYLHVLNWLATCQDWTLELREAIRVHTTHRGSVTQIVEKGYLRDIVHNDEEIRQVLHYEESSEQLTVDDPQFLFFIKNIPWRQFARDCGYSTVTFERRYDIALSFAGADRDVATSLFEKLQDADLEVFYDRNEQHRLLAADVEEYLKPIYRSEARYVVVLLGPDYPKRIWTKVESDAFAERFDKDSVIPVTFKGVATGLFHPISKVGGFEIDRTKPLDTQIEELAALLAKRIEEGRG